jgi:hypothetical protein
LFASLATFAAILAILAAHLAVFAMIVATFAAIRQRQPRQTRLNSAFMSGSARIEREKRQKRQC